MEARLGLVLQSWLFKNRVLGEVSLVFPDRTRFLEEQVVTSVFDRVNIVNRFAILPGQRFRRAGLFEKRSINLEVFGLNALPNALQSGDPNRLTFLLDFKLGTIYRLLGRDRRRVNRITLTAGLNRRDQYLFIVATTLGFDAVADHTPKPRLKRALSRVVTCRLAKMTAQQRDHAFLANVLGGLLIEALAQTEGNDNFAPPGVESLPGIVPGSSVALDI